MSTAPMEAMSDSNGSSAEGHNEEAEVATLGAVLMDREALPAIIALVRPEDFHRGAHQRIFEGILALSERGASIDLITVTEELRSRSARPLQVRAVSSPNVSTMKATSSSTERTM